MIKTILLSTYLGILSIYDIRHRKIPVCLLQVGVAMAMVYMVFRIGCVGMENVDWTDVGIGLLKGSLPGILMLIIWKMTGEVGCGDGLILLLTGWMLKEEMPVIFAVSLIFASVAAIGSMIFLKVNKEYQLPFIPFLFAAVSVTGFGGV